MEIVFATEWAAGACEYFSKAIFQKREKRARARDIALRAKSARNTYIHIHELAPLHCHALANPQPLNP